MLFSVIIPTYNRRAFVERALESVWTQTFADYEVIVVDDGSDDGTQLYLASLEDRLQWISQSNRGPGSARNTGAAIARGEYLVFLDSDDFWPPWTLLTFSEAIARGNRPSVIFGKPLEIRNGSLSESDLASKESFEFEHFQDHLASDDREFFIGIGNCAVRQDSFRSVGGLVEELKSAEDIDLILRLGIEPGFVQVYKPHTLAYWRHESGLTANYQAAVEGVSFLVAGERSGRYPGGHAQARKRRSIITRSVRSVSLAAIHHVSVSAAIYLYWSTLDWHFSAWRIKYLAGFWAIAAAAFLASPASRR